MSDRAALPTSPDRLVLVKGNRLGFVRCYGQESHLVDVDGSTSWWPVASLEFIHTVDESKPDVARIVLDTGAIILLGRTELAGKEGGVDDTDDGG